MTLAPLCYNDSKTATLPHLYSNINYLYITSRLDITLENVVHYQSTFRASRRTLYASRLRLCSSPPLYEAHFDMNKTQHKDNDQEHRLQTQLLQTLAGSFSLVGLKVGEFCARVEPKPSVSAPMRALSLLHQDLRHTRTGNTGAQPPVHIRKTRRTMLFTVYRGSSLSQLSATEVLVWARLVANDRDMSSMRGPR